MTFKQVLHHLNLRSTRLFPKISTPLKIFFIFLLVSGIFFITKQISAENTNTPAETNVNPNKEKQDAILKGNNQEAWLDNAFTTNLVSLRTMVTGTLPDFIFESELDESGVPIVHHYLPGGLLGATNQIIAANYQPMASGIEYIAQIKNSFLGKPAYAATGFESLNAIMNLWKTFRNVVYILISLFFVVLGIMIMLRTKISPQAVVTIQSSLPKIITTVILVTFSYAIAGLCIDLINLLQSLGLSLLFTGSNTDYGSNLFNPSWKSITLSSLINAIRTALASFGLGDSPFGYNQLNSGNLWLIFSLIQRLVPNLILVLLGGVIGGIFGTTATAGTWGLSIVGGAALGAIAIPLILAILILIYMIKLAFGLCKCYINILLSIIFSPFLIFIGIFPNSKKGFSSWFIGLLSQLAVFPATLLFFVLANILIDTLGGQGLGGGSLWLWTPNLVKGPFSWFLPTIVGITAVAMGSKIPTIVPEVIFAQKPSPLGKAIGEGFKSLPGAGAVSTIRGGINFGAQQRIAGAMSKENQQKIADKGRAVRENMINSDNKFVSWLGQRANYFAPTEGGRTVFDENGNPSYSIPFSNKGSRRAKIKKRRAENSRGREFNDE